MAAPVTRGILVSLENTPQAAGDDFFGAASTALSEDAGTVVLDVMANDLGGAAKTLYALDDGRSAGTVERPVDLLVQDGAGSVNYSFGGAEIWITADGKVAYRPGTAFQHLPAGELFTDTFTYAIRLGDGTISWATAVVQIIGADDQPTLATVGAGSVAEIDQSATTTDGGLSGVLAGADVDAGETLAYGIQGGSAGVAPNTVTRAGTYGTLTVDTVSGAYSYVKNGGAIEAMDAGDSDSDVFTMTVSDGDGPLVTQTYTVNVGGADDAPTLAAVSAGSVAEVDQSAATTDGGLSGVLDGDDVDAGETLAYGIQGGSAGVAPNTVTRAGTYGTLTVDTVSGAYSYVKNAAAIEALDAGDSDSDVFTVTVSDGDGPLVTQTYTVNVTGAADGPPIASLPTASSAGGDASDYDNIVSGAASGSATPGNDTIVLTSGNDTINAANGNDRVYGLDGADQLSGGNGIDTIYGGAGADTISGQNDGDVIYGGSGDDVINGNNANDVIYGGSGKDMLDGSGGNDTIIGGYGADVMNGGTDSDVFVFLSLLDTNDTIIGFVGGVDRLDLSAISSGDADGAFGWGGQETAAVVEPHSVTWYASAGNVVILADTDGVATTAEFMITLIGPVTIGQGDFVL